MKSGKEKFQFRLKKGKDQIISSTVNIDISRQNALSKWKSWATPILLRKA